MERYKYVNIDLMNMYKQVNIIGAGVIGLYLAEKLANSGIKVSVYDSKKKIDQDSKKASGILSVKGIKRLKLDYSSSKINELNGAILYSNSRNIKVKSKITQAFVLDRGLLIKKLYKNAIAAGADVVLNKRLNPKDIRTMQENSSNIIVGADGVISTVANTLGFEPIKRYIFTYKAEYTHSNIEDRNMVELFFSKKIVNGFFGWVVPYSNSKLELGIGTDSKAGESSKNAFDRFLKSERITEILKGSHNTDIHASIIPISRRKKTVRKNVILVGDSAGQTKSTTGGGIVFGMSCANIAAECITNNIKRGLNLGSYEKIWRRRYGTDLLLHDILHKYYSTFNKSFDRLIGISNSLGLNNFLEEYGDMDSPSLMIKRFLLRNRSN